MTDLTDDFGKVSSGATGLTIQESMKRLAERVDGATLAAKVLHEIKATARDLSHTIPHDPMTK